MCCANGGRDIKINVGEWKSNRGMGCSVCGISDANLSRGKPKSQIVKMSHISPSPPPPPPPLSQQICSIPSLFLSPLISLTSHHSPSYLILPSQTPVLYTLVNNTSTMTAITINPKYNNKNATSVPSWPDPEHRGTWQASAVLFSSLNVSRPAYVSIYAWMHTFHTCISKHVQQVLG